MNYTELDYENMALITIDVQTDTLDGMPLEIAGTSAALPQMIDLIKAFRAKELPIIHIVRIYEQDGSNADCCRKEALENGAPMLIKDSQGVQIAQDLFPTTVTMESEKLLNGEIQKVGTNEVVIYKPRWGAFYNTPLEDYLKLKGINSLLFSGCNFPNCPRTSIYQASERDYRVGLATDAISGLYPRGEKELQNIGVTLESSQHYIEKVNALNEDF